MPPSKQPKLLLMHYKNPHPAGPLAPIKEEHTATLQQLSEIFSSATETQLQGWGGVTAS